MKLIEKITANPFIFTLSLLLFMLLGGIVFGAFITLFGLGAPGILAGLIGLFAFRQQLKIKVKQGGRITMLDKAMQAGTITLTVLLALISLTPLFTR